MELVATIPGIQQNRMDNSLSVNNRNNILLLVNGKRHAADYIRNIDPANIVRITVNTNPKAGMRPKAMTLLWTSGCAHSTD